METYFEIRDLSVGYDGRAVLSGISLSLKRGSVLTLIGPNGAGKSTLLKTISCQLRAISGEIRLAGQDITRWPAKTLAKHVAVVLTEQIRPELMTAAELAAMGRYPYTKLFGRLTAADTAAVEAALSRVNARELADKEFCTLSDGERQRVLLARAICQEPELLILDEPTAHLDIRHKIELLDILREMAGEKKITVIMSLHEPDLAMKVSDDILCVKNNGTTVFGRPEEVSRVCPVERLFEIKKGSYEPRFGSVELRAPQGKPEYFVLAGGGRGIPIYRELQRRRIPFATGILFENDLDYPVAKALSQAVVAAPAFRDVKEECCAKAAGLLINCKALIDAGTEIGRHNECNGRLLKLAEERGMEIIRGAGGR